ncbi:hypothetical protein ACIQI7_13310 [Kitasatospora sp. NPDC092039]|uniref:hypothetical protein n=1 Tax=Kitasatospora sp. NPDC092039 TaxID=3364086 RepID=UPI00382AC34E
MPGRKIFSASHSVGRSFAAATPGRRTTREAGRRTSEQEAALEVRQTARQVRTPAPHTQASPAAAIAEAVRDRDERVLRRLLARFAEQAAIADLPALRDAIDTRQHDDRPPGVG